MALNVGQLASTIGLNRQAPFQFQVQDSHPFSAAMKENGGIIRRPGGLKLVERFAYRGTGTAGWIAENAEIPLTQREMADEAQFEWYFGGGSYTIGGFEKMKNSGGSDLQIEDLVAMKQTILEEEMTNIYHSGLYSSGSSANQIPGMAALVSKTPTTGTLGGITLSGSDAAFFANYDFDSNADWSDGAVDAGNVKRFLSKLLNNTQLNGQKQFGIMGDTHYEFLEAALQAHQRTASSDDNVGQTHDYLMYRGKKFYFGGGVNYSGESDLQSDLTYVVSPGKGKLQIAFHEDGEFKFLEPIHARNQVATTRLCVLMLGFTVNRRKLQAVGYDS